MSEIIINQIKQFPSYKIDLYNHKIVNLKHYKDVELDEIFEISFILDSSFINYQVDNNLNFIINGKK